jgi:hypothetical protein
MELLIAAISFAAAVAAVVVGQLLGALIQSNADSRKYRQSAEERRHARGQKAAELVLDTLAELDLGPMSLWRNPDKIRPWRSSPSQEDLAPFIVRILRNAALIENQSVRNGVQLAANLINNHDVLAAAIGKTRHEVWNVVQFEAETLLGAYVRDEPIPVTPKLEEMTARLDAEIDEIMRDSEDGVITLTMEEPSAPEKSPSA